MGKNTKRPIDLHKAVLEGFATLTVEQARQFISEDLVLEEAAGLPFGGLYKGPQGFVDLMQTIQQTCPDFTFELDLLLSDDEENIMFHGHISGTTPSGYFRMPVMERWRFENDMCVEIVVCWHDTKRAADMMSGYVDRAAKKLVTA